MMELHHLAKKDAKIVAKLFEKASKNLNIKAIYSSPFKRCIKTANIINKKLQLPLISEERFNEFCSVKNESWFDCQQRIINAIKDIVNKYDDNDTVICVTSGVNLTAFISLAYNIKPNNDLPFPMVMSCSPICFKIDKNCINKQ